jgi:hypothetical protein
MPLISPNCAAAAIYMHVDRLAVFAITPVEILQLQCYFNARATVACSISDAYNGAFCPL